MSAHSLHQPSAGPNSYGMTPSWIDPLDLFEGPVLAQRLNTPPRCYHGRVTLNPTRVGCEAGLVSSGVIFPLTQLSGCLVTVTLDIHAVVQSGIPRLLQRALAENGSKLKFTAQGFER